MTEWEKDMNRWYELDKKIADLKQERRHLNEQLDELKNERRHLIRWFAEAHHADGYR